MLEIDLTKFTQYSQCNKNSLICHYKLSSDFKLNIDIAKFILDFYYYFSKGEVHLKDGFFRCDFAIFIDLSLFEYTFLLFPVVRYFQKIPDEGQEKLILK